MNMNTLESVKAQTYELIDRLKAICTESGLGNSGNEYKIITQAFLYKFLNDKFSPPPWKQLSPGSPQIPMISCSQACPQG